MIPLEREYEGWVMRDIDDSLREVGVSHTQGAVSPHDEATWPSDQFFLAGAKLVGLQFKRPKQRSDGRYYWRLDEAQFRLIKRHQEVFYAFPNFSKRVFRRGALYHTYFWHPGRNARTLILDENQIHRRGFAWGRFLRDVLSCELLEPIQAPSEAHEIARRILSGLSELGEPLQAKTGDSEEEQELLVLLSVQPRSIS